MKHEQKFYRTNTTKQHDELLDLCEKFGNASDGVSCFSLGKILWANGIMSTEQLKNCSVDDISNFEKVGPKRIAIFIKMIECLKGE